MRIKQTIVTRGVEQYSINKDIASTRAPKAGDVGLFQILEVDRHSSLQCIDKRSHSIFDGDYVLAAFGDRYATSQYEGYVPETPLDVYHVIGAGGVIGIVRTKNASLEDYEPTTVQLVGYCCDESGAVINTKFRGKKRNAFTGKVPGDAKVILSIGSTMDSGKTTTAAHIARGLKTTGEQVAFIKLTGTVYTKDIDYVTDCGADIAMDFSNMGFPSTYLLDKETILDIYQSLLEEIGQYKPAYIVMEIADGLFQRETSFLLNDERFMSTIHNTVFSCGDSLSVMSGLDVLKQMNIRPCMISGRFTMSPLLIQEVTDRKDVPVHTIDQIMTGELNAIFDRKLTVGVS
ncbi:MAG: hypothetical protein ACK478_10365 [Flavobacteriales bacterium]|jgi:hypothetical protein